MRTFIFTLGLISSFCVHLNAQLSCIDGLTTAFIEPWTGTVEIFPRDFLTQESNEEFEISIDGDNYGKSIALGVGEYLLTIKEIPSGNTCTVNMIVTDGIPPVSICASNLTINIDENPTLTINDLDEGSHDSGASEVTFSLSVNEIDNSNPMDSNFQAVSELDLTGFQVCSQINVVLNVWDASGNNNACLSSVFITNNTAFCAPPTGQVSCFDNLEFFVDEGQDVTLLPNLFGAPFLDNENYSLSIDDKAFATIVRITLEDIGSHTYELKAFDGEIVCEGIFEVRKICDESPCPNQIAIDSYIATENEQICMSVLGRTNSSLASLQTGILWDSSVLQYTGVRETGNMTGITVNENDISEGQLKFLWLIGFGQDPLVGDFGFDICFDVIGKSGEGSIIGFGNLTNFAFEAASGDGRVIPMIIKNGQICVDTCPEFFDCSAVLDCPTFEVSCNETDAQLPTYSGDECADGLTPILLNEIISGTCGNIIVREWYLDVDGNQKISLNDPYCLQSLTLKDNEQSFDPTTIRWPIAVAPFQYPSQTLTCDGMTEGADITIQDRLNCEEATVLDEPEWCDSACGLVGFSLEQVVGSSLSCGEIIRKWTVIDWCTWFGNDFPTNSTDSYIMVDDKRDNECQSCGVELSQYVAFLEVEKDGFYEYEQVITLEENVVPELISIKGPSRFALVDGQAQGEITIELSTNNCQNFANSIEPLTFRFIPLDQNTSQNIVLKTSNVFSIPGAEINPSGVPGTFMSDFSSIGFCDPNNLLDQYRELTFVENGGCYSFDQGQCATDDFASEIDMNSSAEEIATQMSEYFNSQSIGVERVKVIKNFHEAACEACGICPEAHRFFVQLTAAQNIDEFESLGYLNMESTDCGIFSRDDVSGEEIPLYINPSNVNATDNVIGFDLNGQAINVYNNGTYGIPPEIVLSGVNELSIRARSGSPLNGISTIDLVYALQYILGFNELAPAQIIAADLDGSGDISMTKDITEFSKLILGLKNEIPQGNWFFILDDYEFDPGFSGFDFTHDFRQHVFNGPDLNRSTGLTANVYKYGDLNGNAALNRTNVSAEIQYQNQELEEGVEQNIVFTLTGDDIGMFVGAQASLLFKETNLISVNHNYGNDFTYVIQDGEFKFSYASAEELDEITFEIVLISQKSESLELLVSLGDEFKTEFISSGLDVYPIILDSNSLTSTTNEFGQERLHIYPNPAIDQFVIEFPEAVLGQQLMIYNTQGQVELILMVDKPNKVIDTDQLRTAGLKLISVPGLETQKVLIHK